jgi:hypothetical protein
MPAQRADGFCLRSWIEPMRMTTAEFGAHFVKDIEAIAELSKRAGFAPN